MSLFTHADLPPGIWKCDTCGRICRLTGRSRPTWGEDEGWAHGDCKKCGSNVDVTFHARPGTGHP